MQHDHDSNDPTEIPQEQHERLCAYLFDELAADERAAFEAELAADPALAAERARLEASMALVKEYAPAAPAALSDAGRAALTKAAAGVASGSTPAAKGPRLAWYRHPGLQVAAAAVVAVVAFRSFDQRLADEGFDLAPDERVARFDERGRPVKDGLGRRGGDVAVGLAGESREPSAVADEPDSQAFVPRTAPEESLEARTRGVTGGLGVRHEARPDAEAPLDAIGYGGGKGEGEKAGGLEQLGYVAATGNQSLGGTYRGPGDSAPTDGTAAQAPDLAGIGGSLGSASAVAPPATSKVPPGAGGGLAASAPASPGAPAPATTADRFFLGHDEPSTGSASEPVVGPPVREAEGPVSFDEEVELADELDADGSADWFLGDDAGDTGLPALKLKLAELADAETAGGTFGLHGRWSRDTAETLLADARGLVDAYDGLRASVDGLGLDAGDDDQLRQAVVARVAVLEAVELPVGDDAAADAVPALTPDQAEELAVLRGYLAVHAQAGELERLRVQRRVIQVEQEYERIVSRCVPRPAEKPAMMYFRYWGDNGYEFPVHDALSTFSVDVDTASYTLARRYLKDGYLPERAQIRTEEFVNYFAPDLAAPTDGSVFAVSMELAPSPFGPEVSSGGDHQLLRVGLRGMEVAKEERDPLALTFVVDVSGSMEQEKRLELVKHSLRLLLSELEPDDQVAIITFNNEARRVLDMTSAGDAAAIETALYGMNPGGGTNAEAGLRLGYEEAVLGHTPGSVNRVVFLSDGVGNIGETDENALLEDVRRAREKGIYLNTIGVGMGNHDDRFLEQLADGGDGMCNYVDGPEEARRALVDNFTGAFQPIARDVKVQVEFDPAQVASYRLLGYENRAIADADFRNDAVDAGEVGAGHQVVALYELVLLGSPAEGTEMPLATARVRYKQPWGELEPGAADEATELEQAFRLGDRTGAFDSATAGFQKSALAAQFAEFLRRSTHARGDSVSLLRFRLEELAKTTRDPELVELAALVQLAQPKLEPALAAAARQPTPLQQAADDLHAFEYETLRTAYLGGEVDEALGAQLETERQRLKDDLRTELFAANGLEAPPRGDAEDGAR